MSSIKSLPYLSRLSLESMTPRTRFDTNHFETSSLSADDEVPRGFVVDLDAAREHEASDISADDNENDEDEGDDDEDDDDRVIVRSTTTHLTYDISNLDADTQSEVRQLFRKTLPAEPPSLVLQWCQIGQEQEDKDRQFYAFQLHEVVPRSIRIGSPGSKYRRPRCNCMQDDDKPCKHLIFLLDQINFVSSDHLSDMPVHEIQASGVPAGMGQPFDQISNFHLNFLADVLHCDVGSPHSKLETNPVRLQETREILAAIARQDGDDLAVKDYRSDLFDKADLALLNHDIITCDDLTETVTRMLCTNNDFFAYFLQLLPLSSRIKDPFQNIQQHVNRVLQALRDYSQGASSDSTTVSAEGPRDASWAALHIRLAVSRIQHLLQNRKYAPSLVERASAARTLVQILNSIVFDWNHDITRSKPVASSIASGANENNLYQCLIGSPSLIVASSPSHTFILDTLAQLPEQNQWIETLERIEIHLSKCRSPEKFKKRLREIIVLMRSSRPTALSTASTSSVAEVRGMRGSVPTTDVSRRTSSLGSKRSSTSNYEREGGVKRSR
ncbi:hypothetical protein BD289DRAFT_449415 [Coniella lustricola]|uniref:SWIM-type domain-containing protein n=1 Tax=Coniella lustricola TaxID=2025994 RepID=A0A2T3AMM4_9PEZI|nr:hypothetical protein BD289DRAFT_449415 [Coniella lustricola]